MMRDELRKLEIITTEGSQLGFLVHFLHQLEEIKAPDLLEAGSRPFLFGNA